MEHTTKITICFFAYLPLGNNSYAGKEIPMPAEEVGEVMVAANGLF